MTSRILTTTAAIAMMAAGAVSAETENEASVTDQASAAAEEIGDTVYAIGETATDTAQAGVEAVGGTAEEAYDGAANISAELDAALTGDAVVRSSDGEVLGTVYETDMDADRVIVDLDGEMEGADDRAIENAAVQVSSLSAGEDGVVLDMTEEEFAAALQTATRVDMSSDG
ncbi:hypothetical protein [Salipiger mucosus]|uniref:PRC-barrel domain-containing protein n=1 Tax=Salipiger mucosus DSM 16094 TaxID=1123237 RepID=S9RN69_9RHOB|nr:hypothetical protein [Salipiger mucosus]EPX75429.1 hypothetical protein Salmuc_00156 [Salipiger mucosus DSM 16094]